MSQRATASGASPVSEIDHKLSKLALLARENRERLTLLAEEKGSELEGVIDIQHRVLEGQDSIVESLMQSTQRVIDNQKQIVENQDRILQGQQDILGQNKSTNEWMQSIVRKQKRIEERLEDLSTRTTVKK